MTTTVQVAALVPAQLADEIKRLADANERSQAAEIRLALKAWAEDHRSDRRAA